jgi:hypothetical protein
MPIYIPTHTQNKRIIPILKFLIAEKTKGYIPQQ